MIILLVVPFLGGLDAISDTHSRGAFTDVELAGAVGNTNMDFTQ